MLFCRTASFSLSTEMCHLPITVSFFLVIRLFFSFCKLFCKKEQHICVYAYLCVCIEVNGAWFVPFTGEAFKQEEEVCYNCLFIYCLWHCRELTSRVSCHQRRIQPEWGVLATRNSSAVVFIIFTSAQDICTTSGTVKLFTECQIFCVGSAEGKLKIPSFFNY